MTSTTDHAGLSDSLDVDLTTQFPSLQLARTGSLIRFIGRITFIVLVVSVVAMFFVPWRQTAKGNGNVIALDPQNRPQAVRSPSEGIITYLMPGLREGSYVLKDELLVRLTPFAEGGVSQIDTQIVAVESKRSAAESSLSVFEQAAVLQESSGQSMNQSLKQDYEGARKKWEQAKNEVISLQADLEDKRNKYRIAQEVAEKGLVSREELFSKRQAVESQQAKVFKSENAVDEAYAALMSKEEEIESKKQDISIKNKAANSKILESIGKLRSIEKELIDLQNKRDQYDRLEIRATRTGWIQQWNGLEGSEPVKKGDQLCVIVPDVAELSVEMKISGNDMPLVHEGDRVRLQFEGWPAVQFVGWPSVAVGTFGGKVNRVSPTDDGKGNFQIVVSPDTGVDGKEPWPDSRYLRQGVRVSGWVLLKRVPLGYEIWRQLNGFPPVIAGQEPGIAKDSKSKGSKLKLPKS